jgi:hypothetical protein
VRSGAAVFILSRERAALRSTLDALWSEAPGVEAEVLVHAAGECEEIVTRENRDRARLVRGDGEAPPADRLAALAAETRARWLVLLAEGARPTPGWLRELVLVAEERGALTGPRLPAAAAKTPDQAVPIPVAPVPDRAKLRAEASRERFDETRAQETTALAPACVLVPRSLIERVGFVDARYRTVGGALRDLELRVRARGEPLLLARRAVVWAPAREPIGDLDEAALRAREPFLARTAEAWPRVALELDADDPALPALRELARGLFLRGADVVTFSERTRTAERPTEAPHLLGIGVAGASRASRLVLTRRRSPLSERCLALRFPGEEPGDGRSQSLVLEPARGDAGEKIDAWSLAVRDAARVASGGAP